MKDDLFIRTDVVIPAHELEFTASRAGGPGGQHVNKASTRVTVRWNLNETTALSDTQKERVVKNLAHELTTQGDILVHDSSSRSQHQNKQNTLKLLGQKIKTALKVPKKRVASKVPAGVKESRLKKKKERSAVKKTRKKPHDQ